MNQNIADLQVSLMQDSQRALAFLIPQLATIEREVYRIRYPHIRYHELIPVVTEGNEWAPSVTYFSLDGVGTAQWINGKARDIPHTDLKRDIFQAPVNMAGIGYRYNLEEIAQAAVLGISLNSEKASVARRISEEFIDQAALFGDAEKGYTGLLNCPLVTASPASAVGTQNGAVAGSAASILWANKTPDQIMADLRNLFVGIFQGTQTVELPDTCLLPVLAYQMIAAVRVSELAQMTILEWFQKHNPYTAETGRPLTIRQVRGLDTAGAGGTGRIVAYRKAPDVVKLHMPMPHRFLPVWQVGPMEFEIPGVFRFGGTDVRLPKAIGYLDGVC
ncbi:conserved protein of unknown function (plasmid) [Rhodovastum atsumiense]|uniref:DUF2184 domain-containing protein n=1 Tax=Rhodovastum atsumiense TaxID=504468 RepID=A0A5M6IUF7_9PROT|nr:DUF2184 domain-containing protein [Rhodovastum atsumiense]KAA5611871.1 DUF2184 domain-containing protein [Rhodovastum atsumiense]CAH2606151.1 conserved protein of unknown function [Rhodovastum atsumiense]